MLLIESKILPIWNSIISEFKKTKSTSCYSNLINRISNCVSFLFELAVNYASRGVVCIQRFCLPKHNASELRDLSNGRLGQRAIPLSTTSPQKYAEENSGEMISTPAYLQKILS